MKQSLRRRSKKEEMSGYTVIRKETAEDGELEYIYELIMRESPYVASYRLSLYSVRVTLTDLCGETTSAICRDIFADIGKAIVFFEKLVRNLVTPIDLPYVLEDEIGG